VLLDAHRKTDRQALSLWNVLEVAYTMPWIWYPKTLPVVRNCDSVLASGVSATGAP